MFTATTSNTALTKLNPSSAPHVNKVPVSQPPARMRRLVSWTQTRGGYAREIHHACVRNAHPPAPVKHEKCELSLPQHRPPLVECSIWPVHARHPRGTEILTQTDCYFTITGWPLASH